MKSDNGADSERPARSGIRRGDPEHQSASEENSLFFSIAQDLLAIADPHGCLRRVNPAFETALGFSSEELLGKSILDLVHPDDAVATGRALENLAKGRSTTAWENRCRCKDGSHRCITWNVAPLPENGWWCLCGRDVTERKESDARLEHTLSVLSATLECMPDGLLVVNQQGKAVRCNRNFLKLWGFPPDQLECMQPREFLTLCSQQMKDPEKFLKHIDEYRAGAKEERLDILEFKDGRVVERLAKPHWSDSRCAGTVLNFREVTEHRRAETSLREAGALLDALLANSQDLVYFKDLQSRFVRYSQTMLLRFGLSEPDALKGKTDFDCYAEEHARSAYEDEQRIIQTGEALIGKLERETYSDGRSTWVLTNKMPWRDASGNMIGTFGISKDVTAIKAAEEEQRQRSALLEALVNSSIDGILVVDGAGKKILQNQRTVDLWKIPLHIVENDDDKLQVEHVMNATLHPEKFVATVQHLYAHPREISREEVELKDGTVLDRYSAPVIGKDGRFYGRIWMFRDITDRKRVEASLREAGSLLDALLANSLDYIYFKDLHSRFIRYSRSLAEHFGLTDPDALKGKTEFDVLLGEHARAALEDEQEIIRTGRQIINKPEKEFHSDGRVTWALTTKLPWRDEEGKIIGTFVVSKDITAIKEAEAKLEEAHKELLQTSRMAGMAEVATGVLHNVGNVLNSVNISASLAKERLRNSRAPYLGKTVALMREHTADLGAFLRTDPKGRRLPGFLEQLAENLTDERDALLGEMESLSSNIEHIKDIVMMQQSYARIAGVSETVRITDLVEDALRMNASALPRHGIQLYRDYEPDLPEITVDKHKVLLILVNLVRNAKYACDESGRHDKRLTMRVQRKEVGVRIEVVDNGVGIPPENLTRIFGHGFTTRKDGHGFGLHSGALAAREMGGSLTVQSEGPGAGATFVLELPLNPPPTSRSGLQS